MNREARKSIVIISILLVVILALILVGRNAGRPASGFYDDFAKCLAAKNITMYGSKSCSWCQKEKDNFGDAFQYVPYVECSKEPQKCVAAGIDSTPTWILPNGEKLIGYQGLANLSQLSGCLLPQP